MKFDAGAEIARELEPNERLLWSGVPGHGVFPRWVEVGPVAVLGILSAALLCAGVGLIAFEGNYQGIVPCFIGTTMAAGLASYSFFFNPWHRAGTCYAITEQRAILIHSLWRQRVVRSIEVDSIIQVRVVNQPFGGASIAIDARRNSLEHFETRSWSFLKHEPVLEFIPDAPTVSQLLDDIRKNSKEAMEPFRHNAVMTCNATQPARD